MSATAQAKQKVPTLTGFSIALPNSSLRVIAHRAALEHDQIMRTSEMLDLGLMVEDKLGSDKCKILKGLTPEEALKLHHNPDVLMPLSFGERFLSLKAVSGMVGPFQPFLSGTVIGWGEVTGRVLEYQNPMDGWTRIIDGIPGNRVRNGAIFAINPVVIEENGMLFLDHGKPVFQYDVTIEEHHKRTVFTPKNDACVMVAPMIPTGDSPYDVVSAVSGLPVKDYKDHKGDLPVKFDFLAEAFVGLPAVEKGITNGTIHVIACPIMLDKKFGVLTVESGPKAGNGNSRHGH